MRYLIIDPRSKEHEVLIDEDVKTVRAYVSEFKTHCRVNGSEYQWNHFVNWLKKNYGVEVTPIIPNGIEVVDM